MPPNAQVMNAVNGVLPHSGTNMLGGGAPSEQDVDWLNLAYRVGNGRAFNSDCRLDWWFYDPLGNASNASDFEDYLALCSYDTAPTNTDYPESAVPEDNANLNTGLVQGPNYQRLCLGASATLPAGGAYDISKYQARIVGSPVGYADGWIDTPRQRTAGWHHACIILGPLLPDGTVTAYFYIDDLATPVFSGNSGTTNGFNVIEINSAQADSVGYFDNISFSVVGSAPRARPWP